MSSWIDPNLHIDDFSGVVRLFPLPNFVMFPGLVKGLHIFETRYCAMLRESLSTDRLIAMALLKPGWEAEYYHHPSIYDVVCIGRVTHHAATPEGRHNILLSGLKRAKIVRENNTSLEHFRRAEVDLLEDDILKDDSALEGAGWQVTFRERLLVAYRSFSPAAQLFSILPDEGLRQISLGLLTDLLANELPTSVLEKQALLSEVNVRRRCQHLLNYLRDQSILRGIRLKDSLGVDHPDDDSYPPNISWN